MRADPTPEPGDLDRPPFSNSDHGYSWLGQQCGAGDGCIHDSSFGGAEPTDGDVNCPLITLSMCGVTPHEWRGDDGCSAFTDVEPVSSEPPIVAVDLFGVYAAEPRTA